MRQEKQAAYASQLQKIGDEIDHYERVLAYKREEQTQQAQLEEKKAKLKGLKAAQERRDAVESSKKAQARKDQPRMGNSKNSGSKLQSQAQQEWEWMKAHGEPSNEALNKLMDLIGLETVKEEFLAVKSNIDTKIRQELSLSEERLSCSLLGNPGTGKMCPKYMADGMGANSQFQGKQQLLACGQNSLHVQELSLAMASRKPPDPSLPIWAFLAAKSS